VALVLVVCVTAVPACKQAREWADRKDGEAREVPTSEAAPSHVRPNGPGLPSGEYRIVEVRVEAKSTTGRNRPWDEPPGEMPDLEIRIRVGDQLSERCALPENHTTGRCRLDLAFQLEAETQIELDIVDVDSILDDRVGTATLTQPSSWGTGMDLPLQPSGRLRAATIVLGLPPTWWELHRGRLIGFGAGVALALTVLGRFRRSLMPAPAPPLPIPKCTHCGAVLGAELAMCKHCGAVQKEPSV